MKLETLCEEKKDIVLEQITLEELAPLLKKKNKKVAKIREKLYGELEDANKDATLKESVIKDSKEEIFKEEMRLVETTTRCLVGLGDKASSVALKEACEDAMEFFNIENKIRKEFEALEKGLEDARTRVKELEKDLEGVNGNTETLDYLKSDEEHEFDDDKWMVFFILNEKILLINPFKYCANTEIGEFSAFPSVEEVFDIEDVMEKELIDVGQGVKMTEPLKVEKELMTGNYIRASFSHQGILAICAYSDPDRYIQFTNLNTNEQVEVNVKSRSIAGFYDNMVLLLTCDYPLREASVEEVFKNPRTKTFKEIEGTNNVLPWTDVSLLHVTRILYYPYNNKLYSFNVDTKVTTDIDIGVNCYTVASFTGIDCKVKAVFYDGPCTYTLNSNNTVTKVGKGQDKSLSAIFPSTSNPSNIKDAVFKYENRLMKDGNRLNTNDLIEFESWYSLIRVFKDIFLAYDKNTKSWVLFRLIVP